MNIPKLKKRTAWNKGTMSFDNLECKFCKKKFTMPSYRKAKFCSHSCFLESRKGIKKPYLSKFLKEHNPMFNLETRKKVSKALTGKNNPMFGKKQSQELIDKRILRGEKHYNWKGGITSEYMKVRNSIETKLWRKSVFERDEYSCKKYGGGSGKLNAHHILNFSDNEDIRNSIDNGITLSEKAHHEFHNKYGRKNNTLEQLLEFLNIKTLCH